MPHNPGTPPPGFSAWTASGSKYTSTGTATLTNINGSWEWTWVDSKPASDGWRCDMGPSNQLVPMTVTINSPAVASANPITTNHILMYQPA